MARLGGSDRLGRSRLSPGEEFRTELPLRGSVVRDVPYKGWSSQEAAIDGLTKESVP